ncbi:hypothetical protein AVEN_38921-1 [Araneus ventricosus]|uniref:Uncharacterized protein n=1 Tax=Araneus ventricosus TaxID=182803 RepID=A0A4Y2RDF9_ARAVE|nr:hypothetical protein AVEN_38921-1 [Araneus ventricosus]
MHGRNSVEYCKNVAGMRATPGTQAAINHTRTLLSKLPHHTKDKQDSRFNMHQTHIHGGNSEECCKSCDGKVLVDGSDDRSLILQKICVYEDSKHVKSLGVLPLNGARNGEGESAQVFLLSDYGSK